MTFAERSFLRAVSPFVLGRGDREGRGERRGNEGRSLVIDGRAVRRALCRRSLVNTTPHTQCTLSKGARNPIALCNSLAHVKEKNTFIFTTFLSKFI